MVRTSKAQPSSLDAGALDDLDLDDMFADDGDMLFEGLDIQLEGMGDIISTTKRAGPRTQRPTPTEDDEEDEEMTPKRRKTKRKSKTPVAFGDDDDDGYFEDAQPKKKRKSKGGTTIAADAGPTKKTKKGSASSKSKKSQIPAPAAGKASSTVAAAGRFGKRGSSTSKATKRKSIKAEDLALPPVPPAFVPKRESTYGGLGPSKTEFYPFMESVPPEPNLKSRKQFPLMDKIFAVFNGLISQPGVGKDGPHMPNLAAAMAADLGMESPIIQLLIESFEGTSEKDKAAFGDLRKQTLLASIPKMRDFIQNADTTKVLPDLYAICGLLTRQYNFIKVSLANMETWCKNEFSETDYCHAFSLPEPFRPEKVGMTISSSNRKWKRQVINVKLSFSGHKDVKGSPTLQAKMPQALVLPSDKKKVESSKSKTVKSKEKSTSSSSSTKKAITPAASKTPIAPRTYPDLTPAERRNRVLERVAQLALGLESQLNYRKTRRPSPPTGASTAAAKTTGETKPTAPLLASFIPPEEPELHTARMWEWLDVAGFFDPTVPSDTPSSHHQRLGLRCPEMNPPGFFLLPTRTRIQGRKVNDDDASDTHPIFGNGLFDRLQSLLVVEDVGGSGISDNTNEEVRSDSDSDSDDESFGFLDDSEDEEDEITASLQVDLSDLSIEERTFVHLRSVGLIKTPVFPNVEPVVGDRENRDDELVDIIGEMSADLSKLTARNNARIHHLESTMDPIHQAYRKQLEEEQSSLISRCQSLLKRNKEKAKKSSKQKIAVTGNKDGLNLPW